MRACRAVLLLCCLLALLPGCRGGGAATPDAAVQAFSEALAARDLDAALALVDIEPLARAANSDWDSFPPSQRNLIVDKVTADVKAQLGALSLPPGGLAAAPAVVSGETATVAVTWGGPLTLTLGRTDAGWRITGGLPGVSVSG